MIERYRSAGPFATPEEKNLAGETPRFGTDAIAITVGGYLEANVKISPCVDWVGAGIGFTDLAAPDTADAVILWLDNTGRVGLHPGADSPGPPAAGSRSTDGLSDLWLRLTWLEANLWRGESRQYSNHDWQPVGDDLAHALTPTRQAEEVHLCWPWAAGRIVQSIVFEHITTGRA